jgi:glutaredoxin
MKLDTSSRLAIAFIVAVACWAFSDSGGGPAPASQAPSAAVGELQGYRQTKVVMYSLTTCGYCKLMRHELQARNIPFVEYFLDTEPGRQAELGEKLRRAGFRPGAIGTPTLEVNGVMLPNNPSMSTVLKHL